MIFNIQALALAATPLAGDKYDTIPARLNRCIKVGGAHAWPGAGWVCFGKLNASPILLAAESGQS